MLPGKRKAVILITLLGNQTAKSILSLLNQFEREILKKSIPNVGKISGREKTLVLKEVVNYMRLTAGHKKVKADFEFFIYISILCFILLVFLLQLPSSQINRILQDINIFFSIGGAYFFIYPFLLFYIRNKYKQDVIEFGYKTKNITKDIFIGVVGSIIISLIMIIINLQSPFQRLNLSDLFADIYFFVLIVLGPFCEEIIFRGIIYNFIKEKFGKNAAIIISSIIFTLVHLPKNFYEITLFFLISIFLGLLRGFSSNLISSTIAHSIANAVVYLIE